MSCLRIVLLLIFTFAIAGCAFWSGEPEPTATGYSRPAAPATRIPLPTITPMPASDAVSDLRASPTPAPPVATIAPTPTLAPLSRDQRLQIFQQVWETVRDNYLYEDYNGLDWEAVRTELQPKIEAAATPEEFYALMRDMIAQLGDDHSRFELPQEVAAQIAEARGQLQYGGIGVSVRTIDEGGLITRVVAGGPADQAGLRPRPDCSSERHSVQ